MPQKFNSSNRPDDNAASFWMSPVTRREVQHAFDEVSETMKVLVAQYNATNLAMAFLMLKLGVTKEEFDVFVKERIAGHQPAPTDSTEPPESPSTVVSE